MIPITREPTGLIIVPLRTEPPPPAAAAVAEPSALGASLPLPPAPETQKPESRLPAGCLRIYSLEFKTHMSSKLRRIRATFPL